MFAAASKLWTLARPGLAIAAVLAFAGCDDPAAPPDENPQELITEVTITLEPVGGGASISATITDPDGPGPEPPEAPTAVLALAAGMTYDGTIEFTDASNPADPEDITAEVEEEGDEHRVFHTVEGLTGVTIPDASLDVDDNEAPLGLTFQVVVDAAAPAASGTIRVVLSHFDEEPKGDGSVPSDETDADVPFDASVS
jgi:hypothetical protein